ncbi:hypothetical protein [Stenotrophomonas sp.]|uniref:hypothetical protein n=1 Tax=Stenotrophomonas sp. TaxID=69392 RepID=UPI002FC7F8D4
MIFMIRNAALLTILLTTQACGQVPAGNQLPKGAEMEDQTASDKVLRVQQDRAAAMADAAVDEASAQATSGALIRDGYSPLPQGPEVTADVLVKAVVRLADTLESREDMVPAHVAPAMALGMMPDGRHQRTGVQGSIGAAHYELAAWKRSERNPGHSIELTVRPSESCVISFKSLHDPLVETGFSVSRNAVGFKPMVYFARAAANGLALHVILDTEGHRDPLCVSRVRLEMEPLDG